MRYVFIFRHGERADLAPESREEYQGHHDAPLTERGHQQATEAGLFLKSEIERIQQLEGRNFDQIYFKTSPFSRCMSTCSQMAKANDLTTDAINVDYRYAEWLADWLYPAESPLPHLDLRNNEMSALK